VIEKLRWRRLARSIARPASGLAVVLSAAMLTSYALGQTRPTTQNSRVPAGPLLCDFNSHEGIAAREEISRRERDFYALNLGYTMYGSPDLHGRMQSAFTALTFDPVRAPLVMADLQSGRLHLFDCKATQCSRSEILVSAPRACAAALGARCTPYAVRVEGRSYCIVGPGLNWR
jgi:hypothetical protein